MPAQNPPKQFDKLKPEPSLTPKSQPDLQLCSLVAIEYWRKDWLWNHSGNTNPVRWPYLFCWWGHFQ